MSRRLQIIFSLVVTGLIVMVFAMNSYSQKRQGDVPIVSDKLVAKTDTIRIVGKDEQQRIVNRMIIRIEYLENRISVLESEVKQIKEEIEGSL